VKAARQKSAVYVLRKQDMTEKRKGTGEAAKSAGQITDR